VKAIPDFAQIIGNDGRVESTPWLVAPVSAAIGGLIALLATLLQSSGQRRAEREAWRRDRLLAAVSGTLAATNDLTRDRDSDRLYLVCANEMDRALILTGEGTPLARAIREHFDILHQYRDHKAEEGPVWESMRALREAASRDLGA